MKIISDAFKKMFVDVPKKFVDVLAKARRIAKKLQESQFRHGTPKRQRYGKRRADGPGVGATIHMLVRSINAGFEPRITPDLSRHGWYRRQQLLTAKTR